MRLTLVLSLTFTHASLADHGAALIEGGKTELAHALKERGYVVTQIEVIDKTAITPFIRSIPTNGIAVTNDTTILQQIQKESGAKIVLRADEPLPAVSRAICPSSEIRPGKKPGDEWVNSYGIVFCWCENFWLGKYEITMREFDEVTRKNPKNALASKPNHPRDGIHYDDLLTFISELNKRERFFERLTVGWEYALPTEEEWEFAFRAGKTSPDITGNFADKTLFDTGDDYYHYADQSSDDGHAFLAEVGTYPANPWGLHDMSGNLWEWTATFHEKNAAPIACGGSWVSLPESHGTPYRNHFEKRTERNFIGFRLILRLKETRF
jgi:hypothetical protein